MPKFYLCKCYAQPSVEERFKEFYPASYSVCLAELSFNLLVAQDAKFPKENSYYKVIFRRENPYLITILAEPLTGNLSHMLRFIDVKIEEIGSLDSLMEKSYGTK